MTYRTRILLIILLLLIPLPARAFPARVVAIADGDTITVEPLNGGARIKVRLHGIDAPERGQPHGEAARVHVFAIALYKVVEVEPTPQGRDRYGRIVAVVRLPGGESLQAVLLRAGLAWVWPRYCKSCGEWQAIQDAARAAGRGLWLEPAPTPPWEWRKQKNGEKLILYKYLALRLQMG